jgi:hypothetical protein
MVCVLRQTGERQPLLAAESKSDAAGALPAEESYASRLHKLKQVLSGDLPTLLYLQYLFTNNKTDLNILKLIKVRYSQPAAAAPTWPQPTSCYLFAFAGEAGAAQLGDAQRDRDGARDHALGNDH